MKSENLYDVAWGEVNRHPESDDGDAFCASGQRLSDRCDLDRLLELHFGEASTCVPCGRIQT